MAKKKRDHKPKKSIGIDLLFIFLLLKERNECWTCGADVVSGERL